MVLNDTLVARGRCSELSCVGVIPVGIARVDREIETEIALIFCEEWALIEQRRRWGVGNSCVSLLAVSIGSCILGQKSNVIRKDRKMFPKTCRNSCGLYSAKDPSIEWYMNSLAQAWTSFHIYFTNYSVATVSPWSLYVWLLGYTIGALLFSRYIARPA